MRHSRVRDVIRAPHRCLGSALVLVSALISAGCSDCYCREPLEIDPVTYRIRQPFKSNAYYLYAFDAGQTLGPRVGIPGYQTNFLDIDKWLPYERLDYQGKSVYINSVARENDEYFYLGSDRGLLGYNVKYGTLRSFGGFSDGSKVVETIIKRLQGGVFAGTRASSAGQPLVYSCQFGSYTCTPVSGGPTSTNAGDRVVSIGGFPGPPYYALTNRGVRSSPDGINWFNENGLPIGTYYGIGGVRGDLFVTGGPAGGYRGFGEGQDWFSNNGGLGQGCADVTFIDPQFFTVCNYPELQVYTRPKTATSWTSTSLSLKAAYGYSLKRDGSKVILGTTEGPWQYQNGQWSALDDCLKKSSYALSIDVTPTTLAVGGNLTGLAESDDRGKTPWTIDLSTDRLSARYIARNSQGIYITGTTGTYYRPSSQTAFQRITTIPNDSASALGRFGDTVLAGRSTGGVGILSGTSFTPANNGFDSGAYVNRFASSSDTIFALTNKGNFRASFGFSWTKGVNRSDGQPFVGYSGISMQNGNFLFGGYANPPGWNIAISNPSGTTLTPAGQGLPDDSGFVVYDVAEASTPAPIRADIPSRAAAAASTVLFAATSNGLYVSYDGAASWSLLSKALGTAPVYALAVDAGRLWVGTSHVGLTSYALPITFRRLVPIVLDVDNGSAHYTTELALTNHGTTTAEMTLQYTSAESLGGAGSGTVADSLAPGQQLVIPDVLAYLRGKGLPIPVGGSQGGTLLLTFSNVSAASLPVVTARTTAATGPPFPVGRAGLAYGALDPEEGTAGTMTVHGLRSNAADRSNVAVFNTSSESVTVKVTAWSGTGDGASAVIEAADTLPAWGWKQYNRILEGPGFAQGWVTVERVSTTGTFGIYAVINDNKTNDGSLVRPGSNPAFPAYANVPVLVETGAFVSELILANTDSVPAAFHVEYTESLAGTGRGSADITVSPRSQLVIPNAVDYLRSHGVPIGAAGAANYAGSLHVEVSGASPANTYVGARTSAPAGAGGEFGTFTPAFAPGTEGDVEATINGLRSDSENRSNVAAVNTGEPGDGDITLSFQAYDGDAGGAPKGAPVLVILAPGQWKQLNNSDFLGKPEIAVSNGWVKVTRTAGVAPWIAYGVVNDGGAPGQRTSDGAYVAMVK